MIEVAPASPATKKAYDAIIETLGADVGAMFGMPVLKAGGKGFAGLFGDAMVFKLTGDGHADALALKGAFLFDPSGGGRPMKEWVVVPKAHAKKWPALAGAAMEYVAAAPATKPKPKKKAAASKAKK